MDAVCEIIAGFAGNVTSICISDLPLCINWCASALSQIIPAITSIVAPVCGYAINTGANFIVSSASQLVNMILGTG
jgi:hypothetical protein